LSNAFTPTSPDLPKRKARYRRAAAQFRARERILHAERREALSKPDLASVRPAAISIKDFRVATGLSYATVYRRLADGTLKSSKVGGRRLIAYSEIERIHRGE
jgi:excisionase family DNA binding protein